MSKLAVIAKLTCQEGKRDELVRAMADYHPQVESEDGTLVYAVHEDKGDDAVVWVYEIYEEQGDLDAHMGSDAFKSLGASLGGLLAAPPDIMMMTPTHGKGVPV